jgi:hypothetical protein
VSGVVAVDRRRGMTIIEPGDSTLCADRTRARTTQGLQIAPDAATAPAI